MKNANVELTGTEKKRKITVRQEKKNGVVGY